MRLHHVAPILLLTLAGILPASATGTLDCAVHDGTADIDVHGIVPYGMASPLLQVQAEIDTALPGMSPELGKVTFDSDHQMQFWLDDVALNVELYREREVDVPFGATKLVIKTSRTHDDEEGVYRGTYDIEGFEVPEDGSEGVSAHVQGAIECAAG